MVKTAIHNLDRDPICVRDHEFLPGSAVGFSSKAFSCFNEFYHLYKHKISHRELEMLHLAIEAKIQYVVQYECKTMITFSPDGLQYDRNGKEIESKRMPLTVCRSMNLCFRERKRSHRQ